MKGACRTQLVALMYWSECRGNIDKDKIKPATVLESCRESKPPFPGPAMGSKAAHAQAFTGFNLVLPFLRAPRYYMITCWYYWLGYPFQKHKIPDDPVLAPAHHVDVTGQSVG